MLVPLSAPIKFDSYTPFLVKAMSKSDSFLSLFLDAKTSHELVVERCLNPIFQGQTHQQIAPAVTIDATRDVRTTLSLLYSSHQLLHSE
jgi:hypothetical protein